MTDGTSFSTAGVFASISFAMSCLSALISIDGRQVAGFNLRVVADDTEDAVLRRTMERTPCR